MRGTYVGKQDEDWKRENRSAPGFREAGRGRDGKATGLPSSKKIILLGYSFPAARTKRQNVDTTIITMKAAEALVLPLGGFPKFGMMPSGGASAGRERSTDGASRTMGAVSPKPI